MTIAIGKAVCIAVGLAIRVFGLSVWHPVHVGLNSHVWSLFESKIKNQNSVLKGQLMCGSMSMANDAYAKYNADTAFSRFTRVIENFHLHPRS